MKKREVGSEQLKFHFSHFLCRRSPEMKFRPIILLIMVLVVIVAMSATVSAGEERRITITATYASGNTAPGHPAIHLNDGNPVTYWAVKPESGEGWVELELSQTALVYGLELNGYLAAGSRLAVEYKQEDGHWASFLGGGLQSIPADGIIDLSFDRVVTGRLRLRLTGTGAAASKINEVKVTGEDPDNVFHRINPRSVSASGHTSHLTRAEFLTDGNTYTCWMVKPRYRSGNNWLFETIEKYLGIEINHNYDFNWPNRPSYYNYGEVLFSLDKPQTITNINIYFTQDTRGDLTVESEINGKWSKVASIPERRQPGWYRLPVNNLITSKIRLTMEATGHESVGGISEVEFWGIGGYAGHQHLAIGSQTAQLSAAVNREFKLKKEEARDYRIDFAIEAGSGQSLTVELNGKEYRVAKTLDLNGHAVYSLRLTDSMLDNDCNYLRINSQTGMLTGLKLTRAGDGAQPHQTPVLNDGLVLTPGSNAVEQIINLTQKTAVEQVEVYAAAASGISLSYKNGKNWVTVNPISVNHGSIRFDIPFTSDQIKLTNPSKVNLHEVRVLGSPITDRAPIVRFLRPIDNEVFDTDQLSDKYLVGFVDNPRAKVMVNGKEVFQIGHYFGCHLTAIGAKTWEDTTVEAVATDPEGRFGRHQTHIIIDKLPWFSLDQPEQTIYTDASAYQISGEVMKPHCILKVNGRTITDQKGKFATQVPLAEGLNEIIIECTYHKPGNGAGNAKKDGFTQTVYRKVVRYSGKVELLVTSPLNDVRTNATIIMVTGDVNGLGQVNVWVNGNAAIMEGQHFRLPVALNEGENTITVKAQDARGETAIVSLAVRRDTVAPSVTITQPVDQSIINSANVTVAGEVMDSSPVYVMVNGSLAELNGNQFTTNLNLAENWNSITILARDEAGNEAEKTVRVMVDTQPPLEFVPVASSPGWTNDNRPVITFDTTDAVSGVDHYEIRVDDGNWITPVRSPYCFESPLPDGELTVQVKAVDKAGNETIGEVKVYIDTTPPEIPQDFEVISGINRVILKWRSADPRADDLQGEDPQEDDPESDNPQDQDLRSEVVGYRINRTPAFSGGGFRDISHSSDMDELNQFIDQDVTSGTDYTYTLQALDRGGNFSEVTAAIKVTVGIANKSIDTDGGTVKFDACELVFPKKALTGQGRVVVREFKAALPENPYATKIGPAFSFTMLDQTGQEIEAKFNKPVALTMSYADMAIPDGFNLEDLGIYWYNHAGGYWEKLEYTRLGFEDDTVTVDLLHFSEYQMMASKFSSPLLDSYYNMGVSPLQAYFQDHIETVSPMGGSLAISATDFKVPGRDGAGIVVGRIYDSKAAEQEKQIEGNRKVDSDVYRKTPVDTFGYGWSLNIPWIEETDKGKFIRLPEGQTIKIRFNSNKIFEYHEGIHFIMEGTTRLTMNNGIRYEFDDAGRVIRRTDPGEKNVIVYEYNGREITRISDSIGHTIIFSYTSAGSKRVIDKITVGSRSVSYQYDAAGNLLTVHHPMNRTTVYKYEPHTVKTGIYTEMSGLSGDEEDDTFSYTVPLLTEITYPTGEKSSYDYEVRDQYHRETIKKKLLGVTISTARITYYGSKLLVHSHRIAGKETQYTYRMSNQMGSIKGKDFIPAHTYMLSARVTEAGRTQELTFSQVEGNEWVELPQDISNYGGPLLVESATKIGGNQEVEKIKYGYDVPKRAIILENHYRGGELTFQATNQYDSWGNLIHRLDGSRNLEESWTYYPHDRIKVLPESYIVKNYDPVKNTYSTVTTRYQYDDVLGKPLTVTVNDGFQNKVTRFTYDDKGNIKTRVDEYNDNFTTEIFYDAEYQAFPERIVYYGVRDADGNTGDIVIEAGCDWETGLKQWEKDARGFVTHYKYDKLNRVIRITLPDDDQDDSNNPYREYKYDDNANTCELFNEKKQKTTYKFDGLGRLIEVVNDTSLYPGGVKKSYHYNNLGQIDRITGPRGKVTYYEYDGLNRVTKVIYPGGVYVTLSYDDITNTVTITDEEGGTVSERKDWANRLVEAKQYCRYGNTAESFAWTFSYDSLGNKIQQIDPLANRTDHEYNALGQLIRTTLPAADLILPGKDSVEPYRPVLTYEYDGAGNRTAEISANGNASGNMNHKVEYQYDQMGRKIKEITKATDPFTGETATAITKHYYDGAGNKVKTIDANNNTWVYTYSARGWLLSEQDPAGNITRYKYDVLGNKIAVTDPRGNGTDGKFTTWYVFDDLNRLYRTVLPDNTPPADPYLDPSDNPYTEINYDEEGNKIRERDPNGVYTGYTYTDRNWLHQVLDARGRVQQEYTYDKKGNPIEVKDILSHTVKKSYDSLGRLRKIVDPLLNEENYRYDAVGNKVASTDARLNTTYFEYNSLGWLTKVRQPLGSLSQYFYDPNGNLVKVIAPNNLVTQTRYDELDRVIEDIDSLGKSTKYSYDLAGNRSGKVDRRGTNWVYQYYPNNLLQRIEITGTDGTGYWVEYEYDEAMNKKTVRDSGNQIYYNLVEGAYRSDPLNRVNNIERRFDGATYQTAYRYDKAGLITGVKYPEARAWVEYRYNDLNLLTEVAGFTAMNGINYNTDGSLQRITYANGASAVYNYDANRRLDDLKVTAGGQELLNLDYSYDEVSNIKTIVDNGNLKSFEYDKHNQLTKAVISGTFLETNPASGTVAFKTGDIPGNGALEFGPIPSGVVGLDYHASSIGIDFGRVAPGVKRIELVPDQNHSTHRIDENTIALYISGDNLSYALVPRTNWEYHKDEQGIITLTLKEKLATRYLKLHVKFDERDRDYKPVDKSTFLNEIAKMLRIYQEATARTEEYQYDAAGNRKLLRVTLVNTAEFTSQYYTNSDRLKTDGKYAFTYDEAGNLTGKGNKFTIDGDKVTFTTTGEAVEYWQYQYDLLDRLVAVRKNNALVAEYAYDPEGLRVVKKARGETIHYVYEGTEPLFEKRISDGKVKSYVYALGRYLARVDGVIGDPDAKKYFYHTDHVGSIRAVTDQEGQVVFKADYLPFGGRLGKDGEFEEFHGFTGKEYDPDTGLYYYNARWYDPDLGRFLSEDPAADSRNPNLYSYCGNNPVIRTDPNGQFWWIVVSAIIGGINAERNGGDFWTGAFVGAVSGAISWGASTVATSMFSQAATNMWTNLAINMVSGALSGGIMSSLMGGSFQDGAKQGAIEAMVSFGMDDSNLNIQGWLKKALQKGLQKGAEAYLDGGDFEEGFRDGFRDELVSSFSGPIIEKMNIFFDNLFDGDTWYNDALVSGLTNGLSSVLNGGISNFRDGFWQGFSGSASGALTRGIVRDLQSSTNGDWYNQAIIQGIASGVSSAVFAGDFRKGFRQGATNSTIDSLARGLARDLQRLIGKKFYDEKNKALEASLKGGISASYNDFSIENFFEGFTEALLDSGYAKNKIDNLTKKPKERFDNWTKEQKERLKNWYREQKERFGF